MPSAPTRADDELFVERREAAAANAAARDELSCAHAADDEHPRPLPHAALRDPAFDPLFSLDVS
jgi:hypothetical protein